MLNFKIKTLSFALFILCMSALPAGAQFLGPSGIFGFVRITSNNVENIEGQLSVSVFDIGGGQVQFAFINNVGIASSVSEVYFDDGTLLGLGTVFSDLSNFTGDPVTDFTLNGSANPGNLLGGENLLSPFSATAGSLVQVIPEPSSILLLGSALIAFFVVGRIRRNSRG